MGKVKAEIVAVEQTIRDKVAEALAASGLNVQLRHAENIADRIEALVKREVDAALRAVGFETPSDEVDEHSGCV